MSVSQSVSPASQIGVRTSPPISTRPAFSLEWQAADVGMGAAYEALSTSRPPSPGGATGFEVDGVHHLRRTVVVHTPSKVRRQPGRGGQTTPRASIASATWVKPLMLAPAT
jgi:hypothetical protein